MIVVVSGVPESMIKLDEDESKKAPNTLLVKVIKGVKLDAKDLNGKSDPFVRIKVDDQFHNTKIIHKTLNPEWGESVRLDGVTNGASTLAFECYDHDDFPSGEQLIGKAFIKMNDLEGKKNIAFAVKHILKRV